MTGGDSAAAHEHALVVLGRLTRGTLHEIANPLLALSGTAELALLDVEPGSKLRERLETVQEMSNEITQIVRALQSFVRSQAEPAAPVGVAAAAAGAVALVRRVVPLADVDVALRVDEDATVVEPPGVVATALVELLLDALSLGAGSSDVELVVGRRGQDAVASAGGAEVRLGAAA